jgi:hypothetical protein
MDKTKSIRLSLFLSLFIVINLSAQETEFDPGVSHGIDLGFGAQRVWQYQEPRPSFNTLHYNLNWTLKGNVFRLSPTFGLVYAGNDVDLSAGIRTAFRLKTFGDKMLGSTHNLHLVAEAWTVGDEIVAGGGIGVELGKLVMVSFKNLHHFETSQTWSLLNIGVIIYKRKTDTHDNHH